MSAARLISHFTLTKRGGGLDLDEKKQEAGVYLYIPMVLTVAFLIGCFSVSLAAVRRNVSGLTADVSVSQSDRADGRGTVRRSALKESEGLRYRMVSAADVYELRPRQAAPSEKDSASSTENASAATTNATSATTNATSATTNATSTTEEKNTATEPETTAAEPETVPTQPTQPEKEVLVLPNDHYINFTPPKEDRVAYLTFDDGPSEYTEEILDILDYYDVKATFFVIYHKDMADKYKAIVDRGHTIALHTYTHDYKKIYRSEKAFFNEIAQISNYVYSVTGVRSKIIRFPGGSSNTVSNYYCRDIMKTLKKSVPARGYVYHDWNVDSGDAVATNLAPEKLLANVQARLNKYRKPDILMHDTGASKRTTVDTLPAIIEYIYSQGYTMDKLTLDSYAVHHDW